MQYWKSIYIVLNFSYDTVPVAHRDMSVTIPAHFLTRMSLDSRLFVMVVAIFWTSDFHRVVGSDLCQTLCGQDH